MRAAEEPGAASGPRPGQERAPLYEALLAHVAAKRCRFHVPGHKGGRSAYREFGATFGRRLLDLDLTELASLDDFRWPVPGGVVEQAQDLAAEAYRARAARFLAGGATAGVLAMVLATVGPGETLLALLPFHRSVVAAAILAGCALHPVAPDLVGWSGVPVPASTARVARAVEELRPGAILVTSPTYQGLVCRLEPLVDLARRAGVPLLVDAAHGAHHGFSATLPPSPLEMGASACVVSQHKTAGALTPGALLFLGRPGTGPDPDRLDAALRLVQTSSPSWPVMASVDLARRRLALSGDRDWQRTVELARRTADHIARRSHGRMAPLSVSQVYLADASRLVLELTPGAAETLTGPLLARRVGEARVDLEMAGWGHAVVVTTPGDTVDGHRRLAEALVDAVNEDRWTEPGEGRERPKRELALRLEKDCWETVRAPVMLPAEAFRRPRRKLAVARAVGEVAADVACPCPPGVPLVLPGQRIGEAAAAYLTFLGRAGGRVHGLAEPGATIEVVT